jgi:hypothetical protein
VCYEFESRRKSRHLIDGAHQEFLELCAAAIAGELNFAEQTKLNGHLRVCLECCRAMSEYETAAQKGIAAFAAEFAPQAEEDWNKSWSVESGHTAFFKRLNREKETSSQSARYHRSPLRVYSSEVWMPFAAVVLSALSLAIVAYRKGVKPGPDSTGANLIRAKSAESSPKDQVSEADYARTQWLAELRERNRVIDNLKYRLSEQSKVVNALQAVARTATRRTGGEQADPIARDVTARQSQELALAQTRLQDLQKTVEAVTAERDAAGARAAAWESKIGELARVVKDREQALYQTEGELAKQRELLEHDRDIRELIGARDLYIAEVHDVTGAGTGQTYGRVFYTKGKSLIFYAYDLDAQPGLHNANSFQAWGRRGPLKQQARNLGIFYEDNFGKKRWVLKAEDPKTLEDIDAVFVTLEPNGGSSHPSGKQLLFAYLGVSPNHP